MIQRGGQVVLHMLPNVQRPTIEPLIRETIAEGSLIYTDESRLFVRVLDQAANDIRAGPDTKA